MLQKDILKIALLLAILSGFSKLNAQTNTLYYMQDIHQSLFLNPAYQSNCNFTLGLPALSGVNLQFANNAFSFNDLMTERAGISDTLYFNVNNLLNNLRKDNFFTMGTSVPILTLGFWIKNSYFTFSIANNSSITASFPKELTDIATFGNGKYIGANNPLIINNLGVNISNYHEFGFGLSKRITHRLFLGARLKLLFGTTNIDTHKSEIKITTQEDTYDLGIKTDILMNLSGPFTISRDSTGAIDNIDIDEDKIVSSALGFGNMGIALDMGATYKFNDHFDFFASLNDFGFINWHKNIISLSQKESYSFTGLTLDSLNSDSDYDEMDAILDSLDRFSKFAESKSDYTRMLTAKIFLGATYSPADFMNFGFLSKTSILNSRVQQAITLSANFHPTKWFSSSLSYTAANNQYTNFGIGMAIKAGAFQFYLLTDNLNAALKPKDAQSINLQLGLNLSFGCGKRDDYSILNNKKLRKDVDFL